MVDLPVTFVEAQMEEEFGAHASGLLIYVVMYTNLEMQYAIYSSAHFLLHV